MKILVLMFLGFIFSLGACKESDPKKMQNVTLGTKEIYCDESLMKIISQQESVFEDAYKYSVINIQYKSEKEVLKSFIADSTDVIIISHALDSNIIKNFKKKNIFPRQYKFGKSAIAFITNLSNPKDKYTYDEILGILTNSKSETTFAIENEGSGIALEMMNHLKTNKLGTNVYALKSKESIIDWLDKNKSGIGLIDWSELSDSDDVPAQDLLKKVKLIAIKTDSTNGEYVKPFQGNLNGLYPFTRDLYFIRKFGVTDVGLGFASFICEERGQKIMLKAGLLPEYQTERWVEFKGLKSVKVVE
jgi:phosphate transport system substrate-binding protein